MAGAVFPREDKHDTTDRGCLRDACYCFVIFCLLVGCMAGAVYWSVAYGGANIERLTRPMDYNGNICGVDVADKPYLYICGKADGGWDGHYPKALDFTSKTCVSECPDDNQTSIECITRPYVFPKPTNGGVDNNGVQYLKTLSFEISQSVSLQTSYPTDIYKGQMCAPRWEAPNGLRDSLILGPHSNESQLAQAIGSLRNAWPVLIGVAVLANILAYLYLVLLRFYAGPLLLLSLVFGAILLGIFALFFAVGIFFSPYDENGGYNMWNPIYRSVYGEQARLLTFLMGICLAALCALMVRTTRHSVDRIDEAVGMIHAACGCIFDEGCYLAIQLVPLVSAIAILAVLSGLLYCFMLILSVGDVDGKGIRVNGEHYTSMMKKIHYPHSWPFVIFFYVLTMIWIIELMVGITQFVISFNVCSWFLEAEIVEAENTDTASQPFKQAYKGYGQHVEGVRVHGVDAIAGGTRTGYIEEDTQRGRGKVLVVPIGRKHPDGRDFLPEDATNEVKKHSPLWSWEGLKACLQHIGTMVLSTWFIILSRPLRMAAHIIKFLLTPSSFSVDRQKFEEDDAPDFFGLLTSFGGLASGYINYYFGGFSKDAYVDIILNANNWENASEDVQEFTLKAGGAVAFLHGMTSIYEMIAIFFVVMLSSFTGYCVMSKVGVFNDDDSTWYIQDPLAMTYLSLVISVVISFNWIALFNNTSDTLLYVFAWAREKGDMEPFTLDKYCPQTLKAILSAEMEQAPTAAFKSDSKSQQNRFSHAHNKFLSNAKTYATQGKVNAGERESLLRSTR